MASCTRMSLSHADHRAINTLQRVTPRWVRSNLPPPHISACHNPEHAHEHDVRGVGHPDVWRAYGSHGIYPEPSFISEYRVMDLQERTTTGVSPKKFPW